MVQQDPKSGQPSGEQVGTEGAPTTGRLIVVFAEDSDPGPELSDIAGISEVASSRDYTGQAMDMAEADHAEGAVFDELHMAVVTADPSQLASLQQSAADSEGAVLAVVPELIHHVMDPPGYLEGYRDGVTDLVRRLGGESGDDESMRDADAASFVDNAQLTWGLQAVNIVAAGFTGLGVRVAVLDTGMDLDHPDFAGRSITSRSFVTGETVQDGHGHGTHCIGTACGGTSLTTGRRYGVASEAEIYAGKVLGNEGSGSDAGILAGINWAVSSGCAIISMSLGADVQAPHPPYTYAGMRALARGTLIIAAAGNNARRPSNPGFVGAPANSRDIMAVAAVDSRLRIAPFSARSLPGIGGQVDLAGPGVDVYSSWPMPTRYRSISGTSMATPHAAGIAALWAEATGRRGLELWATLDQDSRRLELLSVDVGAGLVQAAP